MEGQVGNQLCICGRIFALCRSTRCRGCGETEMHHADVGYRGISSRLY